MGSGGKAEAAAKAAADGIAAFQKGDGSVKSLQEYHRALNGD